MKVNEKSLCHVMRATRKCLGMGQAQFSEQLGINQSTISKIESLKMAPTASCWLDFTSFTGIEPYYAYRNGRVDGLKEVKNSPDSKIKLPKKYQGLKTHKVREIVPILEVLISKKGLSNFQREIKKIQVDLDYLLVNENPLNSFFIKDFFDLFNLNDRELQGIISKPRAESYYGCFWNIISNLNPEERAEFLVKNRNRFVYGMTFERKPNPKEPMTFTVPQLVDGDGLDKRVSLWRKSYLSTLIRILQESAT